jgi:hypothetical protein
VPIKKGGGKKHRLRITGTVGKAIRIPEVVVPPVITPPAPVRPPNPIFQWPNLDQLARLDCCGPIVRDCTVYTEGGEWEYSNFQLTTLASRTFSVASHSFMDIAGADFFSKSDNHIYYIQAVGGSGATASTPYNVQLLDTNLDTVQTRSHTIENVSTNAIQALHPWAYNWDTQEAFGYGNDRAGFSYKDCVWVQNGGTYKDVLFNASLAATATATWYYNVQGCIGSAGDAERAFFRGGALYFGTVRAGSGCFSYRRVGRFVDGGPRQQPLSGQPAATSMLAYSQTVHPVNSAAVRYAMYVTPSGDRVYIAPAENTWELRTYDSLLNHISTQDISWLKSGTQTGPAAVAVLGKYILVAQPSTLRLGDLETNTLLASMALENFNSISVNNGMTRIIPHVDGTAYISNRNFGSTQTIVRRVRWAEATFNAEVTSNLDWRCYEFLTADPSRITINNPRAQGADPVWDLALVEQAEGGTPQAFTVDDWGRVVETRPLEAADIPDLSDLYVPQGSGGVLPVVTGEVPPVLVYLDDGSLVYSGVA